MRCDVISLANVDTTFNLDFFNSQEVQFRLNAIKQLIFSVKLKVHEMNVCHDV